MLCRVPSLLDLCCVMLIIVAIKFDLIFILKDSMVCMWRIKSV